jgi:ATP-binding cassette subfamily F protein 3
MPIVTLEDIGMSYGAEDILRNISIEIARGNKIGLIGGNGTGKSTLLHIIAGIERPTEGKVSRSRGLRVSYLSQEPQLPGEASVFDEVLKAFSSLQKMEADLRSLEKEMEKADLINQTLDRYQRLLDRYERGGGYTYKSETRSVLAALGFGADQRRKPVSMLSGGEKARVSLARVILESPDLLLLDEPTNHLDFAALEWVESYLSKWEGTLIVSTHDRLLLSRLPDHIWALQDETLRAYRGDYRTYLKVYEQEREVSSRRAKEQQQYVERTEEFIRRYKVGQRHRQAKDREKKLERLEQVEAPRSVRRISFSFKTAGRGPDQVIQTKDMAIGFPGTELFRCPDLRLNRGERVALIGPNGCGKSTFLKVLTGEQQPFNGSARLGQHMDIGYLPQERDTYLDENMTVLDALRAGTELEPAEARDMAGRFLFSGDDVFKRLSYLSGGELSRVALAKVAQVQGNILLLDEPTNHLDIESREVLQQALGAFDGTVVMVSHDRYLIDALATSIWEVRDGVLRVYSGNYSYYRRERQEESERERGTPTTRPKQAHKKTPPRGSRPLRTKRESEEAILLKQISTLEGEVARLEVELAEASYGQDYQRIADLNPEYKSKTSLLEEKLERWTSLAEPGPQT